MDLGEIKLENINKLFEYESQSRLIDQLDLDQLRNFAKAYCKLYLKQQEVFNDFLITDNNIKDINI